MDIKITDKETGKEEIRPLKGEDLDRLAGHLSIKPGEVYNHFWNRTGIQTDFAFYERTSPEMTDERKELLFNIFVTALEGGIGYWSTCERYKWIKEGTKDDEDHDNFQALIWDKEEEDLEEDEKPEKMYTIDRKVIETGLLRLAEGNVKISPSIRTDCIVLNTTNDDPLSRMDAEIADCIVQAGIFNNVVYG